MAVQSIGTKDPARLRGLIFEQAQLIRELRLLQEHLDPLENEMTTIVLQAREGQILTSIPGIGVIPATTLIARIGTIANFASAAALKSYCGWAPSISQSGQSLERAHLSPRGVCLLKRTLYLCVWAAIKTECEWASLYQQLIPLKCPYNERTQRYTGRGKVIGRVAGQMISVVYALLKQDLEMLSTLPLAPNFPNQCCTIPKSIIVIVQEGIWRLAPERIPTRSCNFRLDYSSVLQIS